MPSNLFDKFVANIFEYFTHLDFPVLLSYLKQILGFVTIVFGILFVIVIYKLRMLIKQKATEVAMEINPPTEAVTAYDNRWTEIKKHVMSFNEAEWKMAVIEGDKFVDDALKTGGYPGESMGERLMLIEPGQLLSLQNLWDAHKLRNLLVHDAAYQLNHRQAVMAIEAFEQALRELGALT
jgi:hypothetical protein